LPDDPKEVAVIKKKAPKFYYNVITKTLYRRSHDGIFLRYLSHKEGRKHSKRLMTVCVELTNLVQNLEIDSKDLDIIGQNDP